METNEENGKYFIQVPPVISFAEMGLPSIAQGTLNPEDPLSKEHLLDSFTLFGILAGARGVKKTLSKTPDVNIPRLSERTLIGKVEKPNQTLYQKLKDFEEAKSIGNPKWKSVELLDELANRVVKYNPDEVMAITKTSSGKLVWLEKGNSNAGFEHVMRHADEFAVKGIKTNEIPDLLMEALSKGKIVGTQGRGNGRPIYEVVFNGQKQRVAITVVNNGFIVGANPKSLP